MRFRKFVKSFDQFGHAILLRFNGKGTTHRTLLGGLITLAVYGFMIAYFIILFTQMMGFEANRNNSITVMKN